MRYAQILNGRAHWVFEQETLPEFAPNIVLVNITDKPEVKEGWKYNPDTGEFANPYVPPTLEDIKERKLEEIKQASLSALASGYVLSNGWKANCGLDDVLMLRGGIELVEGNGGTALPEYRDFHNERHFNVPIETAKLLLSEIVTYQAYVFHRKWELQDMAKVAGAAEEVNAVSW
jgi:hypothetical protein